ncbi:MAG TPA: hypothetical protein VNW97_21635 [Candidatus Saccharimonadales bacterium]|jgi:hypothetical protein|nr:hypothetical protein [Candidatus Saccharimonadales bacterium]
MGPLSGTAGGTEQRFPTSAPLLDVLRSLPQPPLDRLSTGDYFFISSAVILAFVELPSIRALLDSFTARSAIAFWVAFLTTPAAAFLVSVAIHKAGHLLAGWLVGFESASLQTGPLWSRLPRTMALFHQQEPLPLGLALIRPKRRHHLRGRLLVLLLAGPLASLIVPLLLLMSLRFLRAPDSLDSTYLLTSFSLNVLGVLSVLYGVASLLPDVDSRGNFSDGARILMLLENGARARRWFAIFELHLLLNAGVRPGDWDEKLVAQATAVRDESLDAVVASWLAYQWAASRQNLMVATWHLEDALRGSAAAPEPLRDRLFLEAAVFQAWFRHNSFKGRFWSDQISKLRLLPDLQQQRLAIALRWAGGKPFEAWEKQQVYLQQVRQLPPSPVRDMVEGQALEWKGQMESRMLSGAWATMHSHPQDFEVRSSV